MKKILYLFVLTLFILSSCDPMAEIYDDLDDMNTGYKNSVEYTLTEDDYAAIADLTTDVDASEWIGDMMYFTDEYSAADYVPDYLEVLYPALSEGSSAMISYKYNDEIPDDLVDYTDLDEYAMGSSDYQSADGKLQTIGYFTPSYVPEVYIPLFLEGEIDVPESGDLAIAEYEYAAADPEILYNYTTYEAFWEEGFDSDLGVFTAFSLVGDNQEWYKSGYGDDDYAKISGYDSGSRFDNDDYLISEEIDLTGETDIYLNFRQAANYVDGQWDFLKVYISTDFDGVNVATASWDEITIANWPAGNGWTFVEAGQTDISSYAGETIHIAFRYRSSTTIAATWEIDWVTLSNSTTADVVLGVEPEEYKAVYEFDGNDWLKSSDVYIVTVADYDAMGAPGQYDNFSADDKPVDYIPNLLSERFPLAGEESEKVVIYRYYTGVSGVYTITLADTYVYTDGEWMSTYQYVGDVTSQFLYSDGNWVFDPTVIFTMKSSDYQTIVNWVDVNLGSSYVDSYGTQEFYTGAGSYYSNYDKRTGKWDDSVFDTADEAIAWGIANALLPSNFPNAVTQVSGIDVFYVVTFAYYDGSSGTQTMTFQCTKSGPDPEFTWVEE